jgi:flagellar biosynthesis chaperone FliJ
MAVWSLLLVFPIFYVMAVGQEKGPSNTKTSAAPASGASSQGDNVQEYIELLRSDVRQQKSQIMGAVMGLDVDEAAKFWPIYGEYDAELTKLNNLRVANIREYARTYNEMTDAKADELIQNGIDYRKQRFELLAKYYGRVKTALGSIQAARFAQIEDQLLMIIDLQIASELPIVGQGS